MREEYDVMTDDDIDWDPVGDEEYEDEVLFGEYPRCQMICSIGCEHWGGDGLCLLELDEMAAQDRYYRYQRWFDFWSCIRNFWWEVCRCALNIWRKLFPAKGEIDSDDLPF